MEICMKNNYYMEILKCALNKTSPSKDAVRAISLSNLYHFAKLNKLIPLFTTIFPIGNAVLIFFGSYRPIRQDGCKKWY